MSDPYGYLNSSYNSFHAQNPHFVSGGYCTYNTTSYTDKEIDEYCRKVTPSGNPHVLRQYLGNSGTRFVSSTNAQYHVRLFPVQNRPWY